MKWLERLETNAARLRSWWPGAGNWLTDEAPARVEEPPFVPFDLSPLRAAAEAGGPAAADVGAERPPATLVELGVPHELAHELEVVFRAMGATADGRVIGFRFRTPDGASQPVRLDDAA